MTPLAVTPIVSSYTNHSSAEATGVVLCDWLSAEMVTGLPVLPGAPSPSSIVTITASPGVGVLVTVGVAVGVLVGVGVLLGVEVRVAVGVGVWVAVAVAVPVGVEEGVGV